MTQAENKLLTRLFDALVSASEEFEYEIQRATQAYARRQVAASLARRFARMVGASDEIQRTIAELGDDMAVN
jgi:hypothetical protein